MTSNREFLAGSTSSTRLSRDLHKQLKGRTSLAPESIRNAALKLYSELGFHGTGIRQIAEQAGVSLATMYHHMGSKEDLLWMMMSENIEGLFESARTALSPGMSPIVKIETLVSAHISWHVTYRLLCIVSDTELRSLKPEHREGVVHLRDQYETMWKTVISEGKSAGVFPNADVDISSKALLDMCTGVVHWYEPEGRIGVGELVSLYAGLCVGALVKTSRPGIGK